MVNSAFYARSTKIETIRQALLLLGMKTIKTWTSLLTLASIDDKPHELMMTAMVRAKMCEALAEVTRQDEKRTFWLVGLFSILDALMDRPMPEVLQALPLTESITQAILHYDGILGSVLRCVLAYERGNWDEVNRLGLDRGEATNAYLKAIVWENETSAALVA